MMLKETQIQSSLAATLFRMNDFISCFLVGRKDGLAPISLVSLFVLQIALEEFTFHTSFSDVC